MKGIERNIFTTISILLSESEKEITCWNTIGSDLARKKESQLILKIKNKPLYTRAYFPKLSVIKSFEDNLNQIKKSILEI